MPHFNTRLRGHYDGGFGLHMQTSQPSVSQASSVQITAVQPPAGHTGSRWPHNHQGSSSSQTAAKTSSLPTFDLISSVAWNTEHVRWHHCKRLHRCGGWQHRHFWRLFWSVFAQSCAHWGLYLWDQSRITVKCISSQEQLENMTEDDFSAQLHLE